jgi:hypothetical protein
VEKRRFSCRERSGFIQFGFAGFAAYFDILPVSLSEPEAGLSLKKRVPMSSRHRRTLRLK